jgi:hypothetical protein
MKEKTGRSGVFSQQREVFRAIKDDFGNLPGLFTGYMEAGSSRKDPPAGILSALEV